MTKTRYILSHVVHTLRALGEKSQHRHLVTLATFATLLVLCVSAAWASPLSRLTRKGNESFDQGNFDDALQFYKNAQVESPEAPELHINIGNVLLRQKKYDEALDEYNKGIGTARNQTFESQAHYNIGVAQFRQAQQLETTGKIGEALKKLEECMESNRIAMRNNPADEDPKYNFEQAKRKWKELYSKYKDQQQQQQQQQSQEQQKQDQQQQQSEKSEQQQQQEQKQQSVQQQQSGEKKDEQQEKQAAQAQQDQAQQAQEQPQDQQQQKPGEMSREDAQRVLNTLDLENAQDLKNAYKGRFSGSPDMLRDW